MEQAAPTSVMTRDEFRAFADGRPGRWERLDGVPVMMSPERVGHARCKARALTELRRAVADAGVPCEALPDGVTVEIEDSSDFEPDALVDCGQRLDDDATSASSPVVVVEVVSPSSRNIDTVIKLQGYFRVPSVAHYLVVRWDTRTVVHHRRAAPDAPIETRILGAGLLRLDPPGITVDTARFFGP